MQRISASIPPLRRTRRRDPRTRERSRVTFGFSSPTSLASRTLRADRPRRDVAASRCERKSPSSVQQLASSPRRMANRVPFPIRFYAAVGFAANPPLGARAVSDETRLLLYALYQQVRAPSNPEASPSMLIRVGAYLSASRLRSASPGVVQRDERPNTDPPRSSLPSR